MKKVCVVFACLCMMFLVGSCSTEDPLMANETDDSITNKEASNTEPIIVVFGRYFGKCEGKSCVEMFRGLDLREDTSDMKPNGLDFLKSNFSHKVRLRSHIDLNAMIRDFPYEALVLEDRVNLGSPGVYDLGIYYLEYWDREVREFWIIDSNLNNIDRRLHSYVTNMGGLIDLIEKEDKEY